MQARGLVSKKSFEILLAESYLLHISGVVRSDGRYFTGLAGILLLI